MAKAGGFLRAIARPDSGLPWSVASLVPCRFALTAPPQACLRVFPGRLSQALSQDRFGSVEIAIVVRAAAGALPFANV